MGRVLGKYFSRECYRKIEKRLDVKAILACWAFNLLASGAVFLAAWVASGNVFITVVYTLSVWTFTLTLSVMYWVSWIMRRHGAGGRARAAASLAIIAMFAVALAVIWQTFALILQLANV